MWKLVQEQGDLSPIFLGVGGTHCANDQHRRSCHILKSACEQQFLEHAETVGHNAHAAEKNVEFYFPLKQCCRKFLGPEKWSGIAPSLQRTAGFENKTQKSDESSSRTGASVWNAPHQGAKSIGAQESVAPAPPSST